MNAPRIYGRVVHGRRFRWWFSREERAWILVEIDAEENQIGEADYTSHGAIARLIDIRVATPGVR